MQQIEILRKDYDMLHDLTIFFYISYGALWILVILQSLILMGLVRIVYQLQRTGASVEPLEGKEAPKFSARDLSGASIGSATFTGRLTGLLFVSPTCQPCMETFENDLQYLNHKVQGNMIVICQSAREDCALLAEKFELTMPLVADADNHISELYDISAVPTVVFINADNLIQFHGHPKREDLVQMLEKAAGAEPQGAS